MKMPSMSPILHLKSKVIMYQSKANNTSHFLYLAASSDPEVALPSLYE